REMSRYISEEIEVPCSPEDREAKSFDNSRELSPKSCRQWIFNDSSVFFLFKELGGVLQPETEVDSNNCGESTCPKGNSPRPIQHLLVREDKIHGRSSQ